MTAESDSMNERTEVATRPTYAPVALSMGVMMLAWGMLTHWTMSLLGAGLFVWSLGSWMYEICHEWGVHDES